MRPSFPRMVRATVGAVLLLAGCGVPGPRAGGSSPTTIFGARTGDGGRSLVVGYEDGGCGGIAQPSTRQAPTVVTVTVDLPSVNGEACPADSRPRILVIALDAPLGRRRVVDGATGKRIGVFDGSRLLRPTVFPDDLDVQGDLAPGGGSYPTQNWTQSYHRASPEVRCSIGPTVFVTQGTGLGSIANDLFTPVPGPHEVSGSPARYLQDPSAPGQYYLEWSPRSRPGWKVLLQAEQTCRGGPLLTSTDLLRFADSLR